MKNCLLHIFLAVTYISQAQKHDFVWIMGGGGTGVTAADSIFYVNTFDFNYYPTQVHNYFKDGASFNFGAGGICTYRGELSYTSDGCRIRDDKNRVVTNSDSLAWFPYYLNHGNPPTYNPVGIAFFLPHPNDTTLYYLFYQEGFPTNDPNYYGGGSNFQYYVPVKYYAQQDSSAVLQRKQVLIADTILPNTTAAVRHANGRDWWLVKGRVFSKKYYVMLLDSTGPHLHHITITTDTNDVNCNNCHAAFSPDGSKYAYYNRLTGLKLYDFDRCTGELYFKTKTQLSDTSDAYSWGCSVQFSPDSKLLYVTTGLGIYQYEADSVNLDATRICVWKPFTVTPTPSFMNMQTGADGKIYVCPNGSALYYHSINSPNERDTLCDVSVYHPLTSYIHLTFPYFPNYRLGPINGSVCDTLGIDTVIIEPVDTLTNVRELPYRNDKLLRIYPVPANNYAVAEYADVVWENYKDLYIEVLDINGTTTYRKRLPEYSAMQVLPLETFAEGMYVVLLKSEKGILSVRKMQVVR